MTWSGQKLLQHITINLLYSVGGISNDNNSYFDQLEESRGRVEEKRAAVAVVAAEQVFVIVIMMMIMMTLKVMVTMVIMVMMILVNMIQRRMRCI